MDNWDDKGSPGKTGMTRDDEMTRMTWISEDH